ncbi:cation:proton antiporter [Amycolatopsis sp.]|uniref:cation:proton antiporter n=1 Tax=Amycolatopsis sp. TaxID=37632 RepID=UPI002D7EF3E1|nr:cation:proton antiporter [Amycolatopsis sp.]HET6703370.1 cation:proton antiporter [Amycolatopsis sp.]
MPASEFISLAAHLATALAVTLLLAYFGRRAVRLLRQPPVVGEIAAGLLAGPALLALAGPRDFTVVLPHGVLDGLREIGHVGLVLYLLGVAYHLRFGHRRISPRTVGWVTAGAFVPPLALGGVLAGFLLLRNDPAVRGSAPTAAFVLMISVSLVITAVPVLARILTEHAMTGSLPGKLAMASSAIIDAVAWLLLGIALGLATGAGGGFLALFVLPAGLGAALLVRRGLKGRRAAVVPSRFPRAAALLLTGTVLLTAEASSQSGLTSVAGAFLVGLALPAETWSAIVHRISRAGRFLLPAFFVAAGVETFTKSTGDLPWLLAAFATVLAVLGKVGGGYLGTRLAGEPPRTAFTVGVLLNTRGLTEIVVLQAGYQAGILTASAFLALLVMAVVTTAMTGPALKLTARLWPEQSVSAVSDPPPR